MSDVNLGTASPVRARDVLKRAVEATARAPHARAAVFFLVFYVIFFSPALIGNLLLAPGDGLLSYFPAIYRDWSLWSPNIYSGYPSIGDLQALTWYPLRYIAPDYNGLVLLAYIVASFCAFGLVYRRLGDFWAGLLAGLVYGSGGFMMAHLGHLTIIHSAAWLPLILWAMDALSQRRSAPWLAAGAAAVALAFLGGHPQIFAYGMVVAGCFGFYRVVSKFVQSEFVKGILLGAAYLGMLVLGIALVAIQLLPLLELQSLSQRSALWSYTDFITFSMPFDQLPSILFPYMFGGDGAAFPPYFGKWNLTELTTFAGVSTLLLVFVSLLHRRPSSDTLFWSVVAVIAILVVSAGASPVGGWLFNTPVIGSFRAAARAGIVFNLAVAMLAAMGLARLRKGHVSRNQFVTAATVSFAIVGIVLLYAWPVFAEKSIAAGIASPSRLFAHAVLPHVAALVACTICAFILQRWQRARAVALVLPAIVAVDLALFGQFYEWKIGSPSKQIVNNIDPAYRSAAEDMRRDSGRMMPLFVPTTPVFPMTAALNDHYNIPSTGGYGPLMPSLYAQSLGFQPDMFLSGMPASSALIAAGVSHVVYTPEPVLSMAFGGCGPQGGETIVAKLAMPVKARALRVVSQLSCSVGLPDGKIAMTFDLMSPSRSDRLELQVGRDTSEWAYDRPDVAAAVQHRRASIESSFDAGEGVVGHNYQSDLILPENTPEIDEIAIAFPPALGAAVTLKSLSFVDEGGGLIPIDIGTLRRQSEYDLSQEKTLPNGLHFGRFGKFQGAAWMVGSTLKLSPVEAANAVRTGKLPDGTAFDPTKTAIIDEQATYPGGDGVAGGAVNVGNRKADTWNIEVESKTSGFLVISQSWHPGWHAEVNGRTVDLLRTNAAFQGLWLDAGKSDINLSFRPTSLVSGALITLLGLFCVLAMFAAPNLRGRKLRLRSRERGAEPREGAAHREA